MATKTKGTQWVIEWTGEFIRKWWTGADWTEDSSKARWYRREPDAPRITHQEEARAVHYKTHRVAPG